MRNSKITKRKQNQKPQPQNSASWLAQPKTRIAAFAWLTTVQFFVAQWYVALAWGGTYNPRYNYISDLGNTLCSASACSPRYQLMNWSFMLMGAALMVGGLLMADVCRKNTKVAFGFLCYVLSGFGIVLVGFYPGDVEGIGHGMGAFLGFMVGNTALVLLGLFMRELAKPLRWLALIMGSVALILLPFFMNAEYLFFDLGVMQRLIAYPQTIWAICFGAWALSKSRN